MHIMEGYLPPTHAAVWSLVSFPFLFLGIQRLKRKITEEPNLLLLYGVVTAFAFVLSSLKLPSITGSCSHPTGMGLGAILFGPLMMVPVGFVVLLFQALLIAHGGITTLGANLFSMGIVGPFIAYLVYKLCHRINLKGSIGVFLAAFFSDLFTYIITSIQLALAFPDPVSGFLGSFTKFASVFAITQVPLAASEGILTVLIFNPILALNQEELLSIKVANS